MTVSTDKDTGTVVVQIPLMVVPMPPSYEEAEESDMFVDCLMAMRRQAHLLREAAKSIDSLADKLSEIQP